MKRNNNHNQPVPELPQLTPEQRQQKFIDELLQVYTKHQLQVGFSLQWKQSADTGAWVTVVLPTIIEYMPPK